MFKNLLKYSLRALSRQKAHVAINIIGLTVGMVCSIIIALFIIHELSFDKFNEKKDRIYRVILNGKLGGQEVKVTYTAAPIGPTMKNEFPEVEDFLRMNNWDETIIRYGERSFTENHFIEADSTFFNFFSIPLTRGNAEEVLSEPHTLVLTLSAAKRIFGDEDPINKMLKIGTDTVFYRVTGIMEEVPESAHFAANIVSSFMTNPRANDDQWLSNSFSTYVLLHPGASPLSAEARIPDMIVKYVGPILQSFLGITVEEFFSQGNKYSMFLQPLEKVHLDPTIEQAFKPANDPKYLLIFGSIGILIIFIAAFNFMNLATAQAARRAKEVGIKKVSGSTRNQLMGQFLTESVVLSLASLVLALIVTAIILPYFNNLLEIKMKADLFGNWYKIPLLLAIAIIIGIMAGSYPAFYLSSFNPYMVLKGGQVKGRNSGRLRNLLVILQFAISIILIIGTTIMFRQLQFMQNKELGFNKDNVMVLKRADAIGDHIKSFKDDLLKIPGVMYVSASTAVPGHNNNNNGYRVQGRPEESFLLQTNWVDYDYLETYGIKLESGRFFDKSYATDKEASIINKCAVNHYQFTDPFGIRFVVPMGDTPEDLQTRAVIGVVDDFHFESLRTRIGPYIMHFKDERNNWGYISIRLSPETGPATLTEIEKVWASYTSNDPIQYFFMDKDLQRLYKEERQNSKLAVMFTILGILVASLGLFGLTSYTVQQRTKEIGVRKTFGASVYNIWYLIAREILILITISAILAIPLAFWIADNWLQNYEYRINLSPFDFLVGFLIAIIIAILTISYRAIRTAQMNPVISLRYE
jgi:putative ABC transport system permease protein